MFGPRKPKKKGVKVLVKRSSAGLGLYAGEPIKRGQFVIEYVGNIITNDEADRKGGRYLFEIDDKKTIDGTPRWNTARYINHRCTLANCEPIDDGGRIMITAKRAIKPGEELTYDYGKEYFNDIIKPEGCRCADCAPKLHE